MLGKAIHIELPRRVVVHYLLYGLASLVWLSVAAIYLFHLVAVVSQERDVLQRLDRLAKTVKLDLLSQSGVNLQPLVERFQSEHQLITCAVVSRDKLFRAHSDKHLVGQPLQKTDGNLLKLSHPEIMGMRYLISGTNRWVRLYEVPLQVGDRNFGSLNVTEAEPSPWESARLAASYAPYGLGVPLIWLGIGAFLLQRMVRPAEGIESQLRRAAVANSIHEVSFQPIHGVSAAVIGWNRVTESLRGTNGKPSALDQRLSEAIQSRRQERSADVLNSLSDGIAVADPEGRITFHNQALGALLAVNDDATSLLGQKLEAVLALSADARQGGALLDPDFRGRTVIVELKRGSDGEQTWRVARHPIRTAERTQNQGHVWNIRDVTQQKLSEAMRDQFLDSATHELRTPLANIKAYAETLALTEELDVESQKQFCNIINSEATRLARFIDDLLSISSMEVGSLTLNRQDVDIERMLSEAITKVKPQMEKKSIIFQATLLEKYPKLRLDKDKIQVALVNLLGNAGKYTPDGGRVALKLKLTERHLRIDVEDTGVGISPEDLSRIWDKFFRSTSEYVQQQTGTGLGLSLAREVIRLHGGDLTVKSELAKGSTFTLVLPLE